MSAHFALAEFLASDTARAEGFDNFPTWENVDNLKRLADTMELVRGVLGNVPILISSGFRGPALNSCVGGVPDSAHLYGLACDFTAPGFGSVEAIYRELEPCVWELDVDQLINECGGQWIHLGLSTGAARCQCFLA